MDMFVDGDVAVIRDVHKNRYYQLPTTHLKKEVLEHSWPYHPSVSNGFSLGFLWLGICLLAINAFFLIPRGVLPWTRQLIVVLAVYSVFSVAAHEMAHWLALRWCGRRPDKVGVKLNFVVFPAFYVRLSQSLLLSQSERILVHSAGLFVNCVISLAVCIVNLSVVHSAEVTCALRIFLLGILANAVPLLNSDGYRVLLAVRNIHESKSSRKNAWWVTVLKILSVCVAVWYGWGYLVTLWTYLVR